MSEHGESLDPALSREDFEDYERAELEELIGQHRPGDLALLLNRVDDEAAAALFAVMSHEVRAEVLPDLDERRRDSLIAEMPASEIGEIAGEMDSDDAADLVQDLREIDEARAEDVLSGLDEEQRSDVESLLLHEEDTAGGVMARELAWGALDESVEDVIGRIRELSRDREVDDLYVVYVVDKGHRLVGWISLQGLLLAPRGQRMEQLQNPDVVSVPVTLDKEDLAAVAMKHDLPSVPVVDAEGVLLGRVTMDDVYDIVEEEAAEDIGRISGTDEDVLEHSSLAVIRQRLPWLLVGLGGGLCAAIVMSAFEATISRSLQAAYFVPIVMGMGGSAGIQSSTIVVRGLATGELQVEDLWLRLWRELKVSLAVGLVCSLVLGAIVLAWFGEARDALTVSLSLLCVILQATVLGAATPLLLKRTGVDPAIATGPFITTGNDILGVGLYLGLVHLFL